MPSLLVSASDRSRGSVVRRPVCPDGRHPGGACSVPAFSSYSGPVAVHETDTPLHGDVAPTSPQERERPGGDRPLGARTRPPQRRVNACPAVLHAGSLPAKLEHTFVRDKARPRSTGPDRASQRRVGRASRAPPARSVRQRPASPPPSRASAPSERAEEAIARCR